jgi:cbb3-type cytochrome oxidase subunit 3
LSLNHLTSISKRRLLFEDVGGSPGAKYLWGAGFLIFSIGWIYSTYHKREKLQLDEQKRQEKVEKREERREARQEKKEKLVAQVGELKEKYLSPAKKSDQTKSE